MQLDRRPHRPQGIVVMQQWDAEDGHDRVADELLYLAAVLLEHAPRLAEVALHDTAHRLGVARLAEGGGAGHVDEDHGDDLARLRHWPSVRRVLLAAYTAATQRFRGTSVTFEPTDMQTSLTPILSGALALVLAVGLGVEAKVARAAGVWGWIVALFTTK